ncbi:MAG: FMN-binding protein [Alloprevotella sp.]|nr:FMN-binding protein [Alloprevotella sp.]
MKRILTTAAALFLLMLGAAAQQPTKQQLTKLGLKGAALTEVRKGIWSIQTAGKKTGHVVASAPFAADVKGFNGPTPVFVHIDKTRKVRKIIALPSQDTPDFFNTAVTVLGKWEGKPAKNAAAQQVDAVSGATYSSRGLIRNVRAALDAYNKYVK